MSTIGTKLGRKMSASNVVNIYHPETDTQMVQTSDGATLQDYLDDLAAERKTITLTGDVVGLATENDDGAFSVATTVGDDSHDHSGSTIKLGTANRAVITTASKTLGVSIVTDTELGYLAGVTSSIQTQLNDKASSGHNHDSEYVKSSLIGAANGVAPLGSDSMIPAAYLPSYVDDVIEGTISSDMSSFTKTGASSAVTPESGKMYLDTASNKIYRWAGSQYAVVSDTIALGETSSTAYRGDRGKIAYDHSQAAHARTDATLTAKSDTNGSIKINGSDVVVYTHPTSDGNKHVPSGGASGNYLKWSSAGTATWAAPALSDVTGADDLKAIEAITGTSGLLKKTAENTWVLDTNSYLTAHPTISRSSDTTSTASPAHGGTFTAIDGITADTNGHITKINTKTVTLPAQYSHPTYTSKTSGFYKITVDGTGHVSAATAVVASDIKGLSNIAMTGATSGADGGVGMVPVPPSNGYNSKYLRADGTWVAPPNTNVTQTALANTETSSFPVILAPAGQTATTTTTTKFSSKLKFVPSTGILTATGFSGSGASLTNLNMGNASSGTLAVARGGTGGATAAAARSSLGVVNVVYGGTTAPTTQATGDYWLEDIS